MDRLYLARRSLKACEKLEGQLQREDAWAVLPRTIRVVIDARRRDEGEGQTQRPAYRVVCKYIHTANRFGLGLEKRGQNLGSPSFPNICPHSSRRGYRTIWRRQTDRSTDRQIKVNNTMS